MGGFKVPFKMQAEGLSDIGLTQSGAMDELAFGYANMLVGNAFNIYD